MSPDQNPLKPPAFFESDAPIKPHSKIQRRAIPLLVFGFCWPKSVPEVSKSTGHSVATVRALYFDIRALLLDPRYRRWHSFSLQSAYELDTVMETAIEQLVWTCYAGCYANRECQRNFLYKKRAHRECTNCPFHRSEAFANLFDEEFRLGWLRMVDRTRDFYLDSLKIRQEFAQDINPDVFKLRVYHQQIVNTARLASSVVNDDGEEAVDHLKEGPETVLDLWNTLLRHIEERGGLGDR